MQVEKEPSDFIPCELCGDPGLVVGYWHPFKNRAMGKLCRADWNPEFDGRDSYGRLKGPEYQEVMRNAHAWVCKAQQVSPKETDEDDESKPYQKR